MKKIIAVTICSLLLTHCALTQSYLPKATLKTLEGQEISSHQLIDSSQYVVISFWATWCKPCMQELDALAEDYENWKKTTHSSIIAIAIDDSRTLNGVKGILNGRDWPFTTYLDVNQDFKRSLNINTVPYTIIINKKGDIVKRHSGYTPGSENELKKFLKKQAIR
ncbi:MAG: TlpA disulfide reductase family protein [Chitinophagaceae bacterium]